MLLYKCDGKSYTTGKKCETESENELPTWWLSIDGKINNGLYDAHYIECNGVRHFCSRRCLENFLFKDVNPASGKAGVSNMNIEPNVKTEEVKAPTETEQEQVPAPTAGEAQESAETEG